MSTDDGNFIKTVHAPDGTVCLCGSTECTSTTLAFAMMGDARGKRWVELPPYLQKGSSSARNQQRECFLRHLSPKHNVSDETPSQYIALHHFHPGILWDCSGKNQIPKYLSLGKAVELRMKLDEKAKCTDENGMPAFLYCPNYTCSKDDLEKLTPEMKIKDEDSVASNEELVDEKEKRRTIIYNVPKHLTCHAEDGEGSEMSSIEIIIEEQRDKLTLTGLVAAATKCQSIIRRFQAVNAANERREKRNAAVTLQSVVRMNLVRTLYCRERNAAISIQRSWRQYYTDTTIQKQHESAIQIQRVVRGDQARQLLYYKIPNLAAVTIQAAWRQYWVRSAYVLYISDVVKMQQLARQRAARRVVESRKESVLMLQTNIRRSLAERRYTEQRLAAIIIQTAWRQHIAYKAYSKKPSSAIVIQTALRGKLARNYVQARSSKATTIQTCWRRNWPQLQHNRTRKQASVKIQALARGYSCRSKMGWMLAFARLKVQEASRKKMYTAMLEDAVATYNCSVEILSNGVEEIARAERLIVGAHVADQALASALRAIAQDEFVSDDETSTIQADEALHDVVVPTDPVLKSLVNAHAKMADRFDDMSGCGIKDIGPELDAFRKELEIQVEQVTRIGGAIVSSMPSSDMKTTAMATQHAWDELEAAAKRVWEGGERSVSRNATRSVRKTSSTEDLEVTYEDYMSRQRSSETPSPTISTPARTTGEGSSRRKVAPVTPLKTPSRKTMSPVDMGSSSFSHAVSPQSVIDAGEDTFSSTPKNSPKPDLAKQSSGYAWKDGLPMSPSSRRSVFSRQSSSGSFALSRKLNADDCMAIIAGDGSQSHGMEFFEYLSIALMSKNAPPPPPEWPTLGRNSSASSASSSGVRDRWLLESNYHAAASHQALVWDSCLALLSKMSDAVKEIELERCAKLSSTLLVAVPLERRMLLEMRDLHEQVMHEFLGIRHDKGTLSESVDAMVEYHAQLLLQRDSDHRSSVLSQFQNLAPDLSERIESLEAEATYGVTHHAMVVERSVGLRSWKTTLVVATADRCMHLFDLSSIPELTVGCSPNEAFDELLPNDDFSETEHIVPRSDKLLQNLHPVTTVNLRKCRIMTVEKDMVEVTEKCSGVFRDSARKFYLRGEAVDLQCWKHFLTRKRS